jgi:hypothetical protein
MQTFALGIKAKALVQRFVFGKFGIALYVSANIGAYKYIVVVQFIYQSAGFGG